MFFLFEFRPCDLSFGTGTGTGAGTGTGNGTSACSLAGRSGGCGGGGCGPTRTGERQHGRHGLGWIGGGRVEMYVYTIHTIRIKKEYLVYTR